VHRVGDGEEPEHRDDQRGGQDEEVGGEPLAPLARLDTPAGGSARWGDRRHRRFRLPVRSVQVASGRRWLPERSGVRSSSGQASGGRRAASKSHRVNYSQRGGGGGTASRNGGGNPGGAPVLCGGARG